MVVHPIWLSLEARSTSAAFAAAAFRKTVPSLVARYAWRSGRRAETYATK